LPPSKSDHAHLWPFLSLELTPVVWRAIHLQFLLSGADKSSTEHGCGVPKSLRPVDRLLAVGGSYMWQPGCFHNLESSKYIADPKGGDADGFVTGKSGMGNQSRDRIAKLDLLIIEQPITEKSMRE
jgi:hypothetical protein